MTEPEVRFKDFTLDRPPIKFRIADQNFDAVGALSAPLLQKLANVASKFDGVDITKDTIDDAINGFKDMFTQILVPESAERFAEIADTLDIQQQMIPLLYWLLESYGLRPTEVSSD